MGLTFWHTLNRIDDALLRAMTLRSHLGASVPFSWQEVLD